MGLIQRWAIKVIAASLLINSSIVIFTPTAEARPCTKDWLSRKIGCKIDPSNPNSAGGRFVKKVVPVSCAVAGAVYLDPSVAPDAHQGCYKVINSIQNR
jgi:hypothetical protein